VAGEPSGIKIVAVGNGGSFLKESAVVHDFANAVKHEGPFGNT
jgi:hypothetical protein